MSKSDPTLGKDLVILRDRLLRTGLYKTMHAMDEVVKAYGWELAEQRGQSPVLHRRFVQAQQKAERLARMGQIIKRRDA